MTKRFGYTDWFGSDGMSMARSAALFCLLAAVWGTAFVGIKLGLSFFPPVLYAALRYELAGAVMLAFVAATETDWIPRERGALGSIAVRALFVFAGFHALLFIGQQYITSAVAAILVGLNPLFTVGFARAILPTERLSSRGIVGVVLGLVGVLVLAHPDPTTLLTASVVGKVLVAAGVVSFALGSVLAQRVETDMGLRPITAWSMFLGGILAHLMSLTLGESIASVQWTGTAIAALVFIALVPGAFGFFLYFDILERVGSIQANLVNYVVPLFTAVYGWLVFGEVPGLYAITGFVVILSGFALLKWPAVRAVNARVRLALSEQ